MEKCNQLTPLAFKGLTVYCLATLYIFLKTLLNRVTCYNNNWSTSWPITWQWSIEILLEVWAHKKL